MTQEEALALAFGTDARVEREDHFLTESQLSELEERLGKTVERELWTRYVATRDGAPIATAYFDTHIVRSLPETLMVVIDITGAVRRVEVVRFAEPPDYMPKKAWYAQFEGKSADSDLKTEIRSVTGATLSARVATESVRIIVAVHATLAPTPEEGEDNE